MLVKQVRQEGDCLDGFSQPHLISEDNAIAPTEGDKKIVMQALWNPIWRGRGRPWLYLFTCTRSERASLTHPADNLSVQGWSPQYMTAASSEQQILVFALIPEMIETHSFIYEEQNMLM